ncbi:MAG: hypothetical protein O9972_07650, partial [Burkholderiales bacterium]|nr:hypothetical protein [Burkholderiales bacterium]
ARDGSGRRRAAGAARAAAADGGAGVRAEAEAEADAERIRAMAAKIRHEIEAEGQRLMNEAANTLTLEARMSAMRMRLIDRLEGIIREQVKPMERIEGIKILHVDGLGGGGGNGYDMNGSGGGFADGVVNSALRYRAQAPLVDQLLREIGIQGGDVGHLATGMLERATIAGAGAVAGASGQGGGNPALPSGPQAER